MKTIKQFLLVTLAVMLWIPVAMADEKAGQSAPPGPTVVYQAKFPIMVQGADYDLVNLILDFPSGTGIPKHIHGGPVLATVLSGEITLIEKGTQIIKKIGESWTEKPGDEHAVINAGKETVRVVVSILLPKGAEATSLVK